MASSAKSGMVDSICLAKQADLEAVAFSGTGRRLARAAIGLGKLVVVVGGGVATIGYTNKHKVNWPLGCGVSCLTRK